MLLEKIEKGERWGRKKCEKLGRERVRKGEADFLGAEGKIRCRNGNSQGIEKKTYLFAIIIAPCFNPFREVLVFPRSGGVFF